MYRETITEARFTAIIDSIPPDALGVGFSLQGVSYSYAREQSGHYKGKPYTKPAHIQITTPDQRFRIAWQDRALKFSHDPTGGFTFVPLTEHDAWQELEQHFGALEDRLQALKSKPQAVRDKVDLKALRDFIAIVLGEGDARQRTAVQEAAALAVTAPQDYLQSHQEQLAWRGITRPTCNLYVIALVDALQRIGAATEIDWNADEATVLQHVSSLARHVHLAVPPERTGGTLQVPELLRVLGQHVAKQGYVLVTLDMDADSYAICLVPGARYAQSVALARKAGLAISALGA